MTQIERLPRPTPPSEHLVPFAYGVSRYHIAEDKTRTEYQYNVIFPGSGVAYYPDGTSQEFSIEVVDREQMFIPAEFTETNFQVIAAVSPLGGLHLFYPNIDKDTGKLGIHHSAEYYDPRKTERPIVSLQTQGASGLNYDFAKFTFIPPSVYATTR